MNPIKVIIPTAIAIALSSCATKNDDYDTSYGPADAGDSAAYDAAAPTNQTYDTPAAYEDAGAAGTPNIPVPSESMPAAPSPAPAAGGGGIATTHTVVKGDTLGGIAKKHNVSIASIKAANAMTSDIVVLGKTLKIPAN
ncbi:MAG: LysM peptidoglycan-binding domain-containing protein [Verrucomicrobiaceae bacterium]|nr:MAG: LysM peptidoglycan-binding domain-containing protein [Verrucomicrobiaceae bacterium]